MRGLSLLLMAAMAVASGCGGDDADADRALAGTDSGEALPAPERTGGSVVIDDFTPLTEWPPMHEGRPDSARLSWLEHPALLASEVRLAPDLSTIVGTRRP